MSFTVYRTPQELYVDHSVLNSLPIDINSDNVIQCKVGRRGCSKCGYRSDNNCYSDRKRDSAKIFTILKNNYPELLI